MEFRVTYKKISCFEVSQDSIFTGFSDGTVQWWDLQGACLMTFGKNQQEIAFIQHRVGEGSCIFTGSVDGTIQKWDTQGTCIGQLNRLENKEEQQALVPIVDLVATGDHLFVGYKNGLLEIWDSSDDLLHSLKNAAGVLVDPKDSSLDLVTRIETLKKLRVSDSCAFMCFETSFEIWDLEKKTALSFPSHNGTILDVQLFEEHFFTAYSDGTIKLWKIDGKCERTFSFANNQQLSCAMFKNDLFFGFLNGQIKKYQFNSKKEDVLNDVAMELLSSKNNAARFLAMPQDIQNSVMQVLEKEANMSLWTYFSSILFSPEDALTGKVTKTFFACKEGLDSLYARYVKGIDPYQIQLAFAIKHSLK
jgi:WD40 repeat protein